MRIRLGEAGRSGERGGDRPAHGPPPVARYPLARVDEKRAGGDRGDRGRVGRGKFWPGGADEHGVGAGGRGQGAVGLAQVRERDQGVACRLRVVDHDPHAKPAEPVRDIQGRRVAHVVRARLERRAPERDCLTR
jgi:hypothetical protein